MNTIYRRTIIMLGQESSGYIGLPGSPLLKLEELIKASSNPFLYNALFSKASVFNSRLHEYARNSSTATTIDPILFNSETIKEYTSKQIDDLSGLNETKKSLFIPHCSIPLFQLRCRSCWYFLDHNELYFTFEDQTTAIKNNEEIITAMSSTRNCFRQYSVKNDKEEEEEKHEMIVFGTNRGRLIIMSLPNTNQLFIPLSNNSTTDSTILYQLKSLNYLTCSFNELSLLIHHEDIVDPSIDLVAIWKDTVKSDLPICIFSSSVNGPLKFWIVSTTCSSSSSFNLHLLLTIDPPVTHKRITSILIINCVKLNQHLFEITAMCVWDNYAAFQLKCIVQMIGLGVKQWRVTIKRRRLWDSDLSLGAIIKIERVPLVVQHIDVILVCVTCYNGIIILQFYPELKIILREIMIDHTSLIPFINKSLSMPRISIGVLSIGRHHNSSFTDVEQECVHLLISGPFGLKSCVIYSNETTLWNISNGPIIPHSSSFHTIMNIGSSISVCIDDHNAIWFATHWNIAGSNISSVIQASNICHPIELFDLFQIEENHHYMMIGKNGYSLEIKCLSIDDLIKEWMICFYNTIHHVSPMSNSNTVDLIDLLLIMYDDVSLSNNQMSYTLPKQAVYVCQSILTQLLSLSSTLTSSTLYSLMIFLNKQYLTLLHHLFSNDDTSLIEQTLISNNSYYCKHYDIMEDVIAIHQLLLTMMFNMISIISLIIIMEFLSTIIPNTWINILPNEFFLLVSKIKVSRPMENHLFFFPYFSAFFNQIQSQLDHIIRRIEQNDVKLLCDHNQTHANQQPETFFSPKIILQNVLSLYHIHSGHDMTRAMELCQTTVPKLFHVEILMYFMWYYKNNEHYSQWFYQYALQLFVQDIHSSSLNSLIKLFSMIIQLYPLVETQQKQICQQYYLLEHECHLQNDSVSEFYLLYSIVLSAFFKQPPNHWGKRFIKLLLLQSDITNDTTKMDNLMNLLNINRAYVNELLNGFQSISESVDFTQFEEHQLQLITDTPLKLSPILQYPQFIMSIYSLTHCVTEGLSLLKHHVTQHIQHVTILTHLQQLIPLFKSVINQIIHIFELYSSQFSTQYQISFWTDICSVAYHSKFYEFIVYLYHSLNRTFHSNLLSYIELVRFLLQQEVSVNPLEDLTPSRTERRNGIMQEMLQQAANQLISYEQLLTLNCHISTSASFNMFKKLTQEKGIGLPNGHSSIDLCHQLMSIDNQRRPISPIQNEPVSIETNRNAQIKDNVISTKHNDELLSQSEILTEWKTLSLTDNKKLNHLKTTYYDQKDMYLVAKGMGTVNDVLVEEE